MANVNVTVANGTIFCDPETVLVSKQDQNLVTFTLRTEGCSFPDQAAVVMKKRSSDFPEDATTATSSLVKLVDLNQVKGVYAYSVQVIDTGGKLLELDPGIDNDGGG